MRRPLGVLAGIGLLGAAACAPGTAAETAAPLAGGAAAPVVSETAAPSPTASEPDADCRVSVARPRLTGAPERIVAGAARRGCARPALLRIRLVRAAPGRDPVVKSGARKNGRVSVALPCKAGTYYATATDYRGHTVKSKPAKVTCAPPSSPPGSTPAPTADDPAPTRTAEPGPTPTRAPSGAGGVGTARENEVVRLTNAERAKGGCGPLKHHPQLRAAAFGHSSDMAKRDYFDHTSPEGRDVGDRIAAAGFSGQRAWGENIAFGQPSAASVVRGWMNSPGHRQNIMNCTYNLIGVGAADNGQGRIYWTQVFAAR
ncbi:MAG TPA: CAP domain-containing protein [Nonomuraea sp.]|nr:CAP domain-containing protein [Nonomuraea sp.]